MNAKTITKVDWDKLKAFYYVAQAKSFTQASEYLNLTQSSLSRIIRNLEGSLGYPLFIRKQDGLILTEQGQILLQSAQNILSELILAENKINEESQVPRGLLRVAPIAGFFSLYIAPHIPRFLELYPEIHLAFFGTDRAPQLERFEADVMIHPFAKDRPDLIQRPLLSFNLALYASPAYLKKYGTPTSPTDLDNHRLIASGTHHVHPFTNANWVLYLGKEPGSMRIPYIEENSSVGRMALAQAGLGIATLVKEQPNLRESGLVQLLPDLKAPPFDLYYTYSEILKHSKRVEVFWTYLSEAFQEEYSQ